MNTLDDNHYLSKSCSKPPARMTRYQSRASVHRTCTAWRYFLRYEIRIVTSPVNMFIRAVDNPYPLTPLSFSPPHLPPPFPIEFSSAFSKLTYRNYICLNYAGYK